MSTMTRSTKRISLLLLVLGAFSGCVHANYATHPIAAQRAQSVKRIVILPPRVDVFEIGAGGVVEKIDDWSLKGSENVANAFREEFSNLATVQVSTLDKSALSDALAGELEQTEKLFDAVAASVVLHVFGVAPFAEKHADFDYSLGKETAALNAADADAFLIVKALDQISSAGRQALQLTTMVAAAALRVMVVPQLGITAMNIALVDARNGDILWWKSSRSDGGHDLRNPASATRFVQNSLSEFPIK